MLLCLSVLVAYLYLFLYISNAAVSPSLSRVALHSRCAVGPSGTVFPDHLSRVLQVYPLCELYVPSCLLQLSLGCSLLVSGKVDPQAD